MQRKKDKIELTVSINKSKLGDLLLVFGFMAFFVAIGVGIGWVTWSNAGKHFRRETVPGWFTKEKGQPEKTVVEEPVEYEQPVNNRPTQPQPDNGSQKNLPDKNPDKGKDPEEEGPQKLF